MRTLPFLLVLSACGSTKLVIDGDSGGVGVDDTGTSGSDSGSPGDYATTGNDSGTADTSSTDTGAPPDTGVTEPDTTVTYIGTLEGTISIAERGGGSQVADCRGDVRLVRSPDGSLWGQASCDTREWSLDGNLDASWSRGSWDGTWVVDLGRDTVDVAVDGTLDDRRLDGDVTYDSDWLAFEGTISASAQ